MTWSRGAVPQAGPERAHEQLAVSVIALPAAKITERGGAVIGVGPKAAKKAKVGTLDHIR